MKLAKSGAGGGCRTPLPGRRRLQRHWRTIAEQGRCASPCRCSLTSAGTRCSSRPAGTFPCPTRTCCAGAVVIHDQVKDATPPLWTKRRRDHRGHARFVASTRSSQPARSGTRRYEAETFIVATGSHPYHPADVDFAHPRVRDSDSILSLDHRPPGSITIYGAGVIGCEYASVFAHLDVKVNLVNTRDRLLSFLDTEITDALSYHLRHSASSSGTTRPASGSRRWTTASSCTAARARSSSRTSCSGRTVAPAPRQAWGSRSSASR